MKRDLTSFAVNHWQFTVIVFAMLVVLGLASWHSIPRAEDPTLDFPVSTIVAVYPGGSPSDLERLVVTDIEERLSQLEHVKHIDSRMRDGVATVRVEFDEDQEPTTKYDEVVREMDALRPQLPRELARFDIIRTTTLEVNVLQVALVSPLAPYGTLDSLAEELEDRLGAVPGVREAERWGVPPRQVEIALDVGRLAEMRLPVGLLMQAVEGRSVEIPGGNVDAGLRRFSVRNAGGYETLQEIRSTVVRGSNGRSVRIGDVAGVSWKDADSTHRARFDGRRAVFVTVNQQAGVNVKDLSRRLSSVLDDFAVELPDGIALERGFDQAVNVTHRLQRLGVDFAIAIGLVLLTLLPLGFRASAIVMTSVPLSFAIGITTLHWLGYSLNQLTIVGLVIALGLLVDDSIVVVENISRLRRRGVARAEAAISATQEILSANVGATATLIAAFVPLLVLPGGAGQFLRSTPVAVVATVSASLLVSITIIPWLASRVLPEHMPPEGNRALRAFDRLIHQTYAPLLERALRHPWRTLAGALFFVGASIALVPVVGFSLFPKAGTPQFMVNITAPQGASIAATDSAARFAERVLAARPEVTGMYTSVGHDNPMVYYNVGPRQDDPRVGQLFVLLDEYDPHRTPVMLDTLREQLSQYAGAEIMVREFQNGPPVDAPIALRIVGPNLDTLRAVAGRMEALFEGTPGTQYVTNPMRLAGTDLRVDIDHAKAGLLGVSALEISRTIRLGIAGLSAGELREDDGDKRDIIFGLAHDGRPAASDLERLYVATGTGNLTPLAHFATTRFERAVPEIQRYDRRRTVTIGSDVRTGFNTDRVTKSIMSQIDSIDMPAGYSLVAGGEIESRQHSFGGVGSAVIVAVFLIIAILVLEFRTFRATIIVASVIPLGLSGGILALLLSGQTLSFSAAIGFVALIGIEIKTSILLVDLTNRLRAEGVGLEEAIRRAGEIRFLPIVLTSLTALGGLLPLAIQGSGIYAPLAWVIIGGLVSSTLLARIVTPVMYKVVNPVVPA